MPGWRQRTAGGFSRAGVQRGGTSLRLATSAEAVGGHLGKGDVLRGRGQFGHVITRGRSVSAGFLRASYVVTENGLVRCGISVARQTGNSVRRNRIKRLLREAIRHERRTLQARSKPTRVGVDIVFRFRPTGAPPLRQLSLHHFQPEVEKIFGTIVTRIQQ